MHKIKSEVASVFYFLYKRVKMLQSVIVTKLVHNSEMAGGESLIWHRVTVRKRRLGERSRDLRDLVHVME